MNRLGLIAWLAAAALPSFAQAALVPPDITNTNKSIMAIEGSGPCFADSPGGPAAVIAPGGDCSLLFTFTTHLLPVENDDEGTVKPQFVTAFEEDVPGTTTSGFGFITVRAPPVNLPEPATLFLLGSGLLAFVAARPRRSRVIAGKRGA